jgi:hypothetical protein
VIEKIVEGKMAKFYEEVCLLEQPFIKDQTISIKELIAQKVGKLGENITVRRFARFKVGAPDWTDQSLGLFAWKRLCDTRKGMYKRIVLKLSGEALAGRAALAWMPTRSPRLPARSSMCTRWAWRSASWWAEATSSAAWPSRPRRWTA